MDKQAFFNPNECNPLLQGLLGEQLKVKSVIWLAAMCNWAEQKHRASRLMLDLLNTWENTAINVRIWLKELQSPQSLDAAKLAIRKNSQRQVFPTVSITGQLVANLPCPARVPSKYLDNFIQYEKACWEFLELYVFFMCLTKQQNELELVKEQECKLILDKKARITITNELAEGIEQANKQDWEWLKIPSAACMDTFLDYTAQCMQVEQGQGKGGFYWVQLQQEIPFGCWVKSNGQLLNEFQSFEELALKKQQDFEKYALLSLQLDL